jgi:molecular chaperone GrpE (heat shock protein)
MDVGSEFDPRLHMAMGTQPEPGLADGSIAKVMVRGYFLNNTVFRTAQVVLVKNTAA